MSDEYRRQRTREDAGQTGREEPAANRQRQVGGGEPGKGPKDAIRGYKELRVYQGAMEAAMRVFEVTKEFPAEERPSMVVQVRRSSRAVCTHIGEAWRRRRSQAQFVGKLCDSEGEAEETRVWIDFATRCHYLSQDEAADLAERYDKILAQLVKMISDPERWTIRPREA